MTNKKAHTIDSTPDNWGPDGMLGNDEAHAVAAPTDISADVDAALGLQAISIRLHKALLEDLKLIANENGIGYQPLIRQVLTRFASSEIKRMLTERIAMENIDTRRKAA